MLRWTHLGLSSPFLQCVAVCMVSCMTRFKLFVFLPCVAFLISLPVNVSWFNRSSDETSGEKKQIRCFKYLFFPLERSSFLYFLVLHALIEGISQF